MKPSDRTLGSFEQKIIQAAKHVQIDDLTPLEASTIKNRIQFVLFDSNPADLTIAQLGEWVRRVVPGMRRSNAVLANHDRIADGAPVRSKNLPSSLRAVVAKHETKAADEALAAGECFCSLVGDRKVRFSSHTMVVTPLRLPDAVK